MKKSLKLVSLILAALMVLSLAACSGNTNNKVEESTPVSESAPDELAVETTDMNGEEGDISSLSQNDSGASQNSNANADGTYTWQLGGTELKTRTNIQNYLDGKNWDMKGMTADIGFDVKNGMLFWKEDSDVTTRVNVECNNNLCGLSIWTWETESEANIVQFYIYDINGSFDNKYLVNGSSLGIEVSYEFIVAYTYVCEHILEDPYTDAADGVLPLRKTPNIYQLG